MKFPDGFEVSQKADVTFIPTPGADDEAGLRHAIEYCDRMAAIFSAQGSPEVVTWYVQGGAYKSALRKLLANRPMDAEDNASKMRPSPRPLPDGFMSFRQIAEFYGVEDERRIDALRQRLRRFAKKNPECVEERELPRVRQASHVYHCKLVQTQVNTWLQSADNCPA